MLSPTRGGSTGSAGIASRNSYIKIPRRIILPRSSPRIRLCIVTLVYYIILFRNIMGDNVCEDEDEARTTMTMRHETRRLGNYFGKFPLCHRMINGDKRKFKREILFLIMSYDVGV